MAGRQDNGSVKLFLAAEQQSGAADRLRQICEQLNQTTATLSLPLFLRMIEARVA